MQCKGALTNAGVAARCSTTCCTEGGGDEEEQRKDGKKPGKQEATVGYHLSGLATDTIGVLVTPMLQQPAPYIMPHPK
jgi:hypothetical protein